MLQISTKDKRQDKLVEIDGYTYSVRKAGAGESLTLQEYGRELEKLGKVELTAEQTKQVEEMATKLLSICLSLFKSDDKKATDYIQTIELELLMDIIKQVYDETPNVS